MCFEVNNSAYLLWFILLLSKYSAKPFINSFFKQKIDYLYAYNIRKLSGRKLPCYTCEIILWNYVINNRKNPNKYYTKQNF